MIAAAILRDIGTRVDRAEMRYGAFKSTHEAIGVISEEWDELRAEVRANDLHAVYMEALDAAAALIRLAQATIDGQAFAKRSSK